MSALAKIHIAKKQLGLDDDLYRDAMFMVVGKRSAKEMTEPERVRVLKHFESCGFKPASNAGSKARFNGPAAAMAKKINALWLSGWNLGVIDTPSTSAMEKFISRQTGIAKVQWLADHAEARKVIEALKSWLAREAGVRWSKDDHARDVVAAQFRLLNIDESTDEMDGENLIEVQRRLGKVIRMRSR
jgi:phage gp16-like protein